MLLIGSSLSFCAENVLAQFTESKTLKFCNRYETALKYVIASDNISTYILNEENKLISVNLNTLNKSWEYETPINNFDGKLFANNKRLLLTYKKKFAEDFGETVNNDNSTLPKFTILNTETGIPVEDPESELKEYKEDMEISENQGIGQLDSTLDASKRADKFVQNKKILSNITEILPAQNNRVILFGFKNGTINTFNSANGSKIWEMKAGGEISTATATNRGFLIGSFDNFVYHVGFTKGDIFWKKRFTNRIRKIYILNDSVAAVEIVGTNVLELIEIKNGKIISEINRNSNGDLLSIKNIGEDQYLVYMKSGIEKYAVNGCPN